MLLLRTSKGMGLVEVMIAIFLTSTAIFAAFSLQAPAWKAAAKADYTGRASEIMHRQLESTEAYLMNQCNTVASSETGVPAIPVAGANASSTYNVSVSGLGGIKGDATYTVTTAIAAQTVTYFRVTVTVTWPPLNPTGITQTIFVSRQQYFKNGC
ncbi:MAG: hypothetical protein K4571_07025 [Deltaproteobacteria bacterium]